MSFRYKFSPFYSFHGFKKWFLACSMPEVHFMRVVMTRGGVGFPFEARIQWQRRWVKRRHRIFVNGLQLRVKNGALSSFPQQSLRRSSRCGTAWACPGTALGCRGRSAVWWAPARLNRGLAPGLEPNRRGKLPESRLVLAAERPLPCPRIPRFDPGPGNAPPSAPKCRCRGSSRALLLRRCSRARVWRRGDTRPGFHRGW